MNPLRLTVHHDAPDWVIGDCMAVMSVAFDPRFGEAWSASQARSIMTMPGTALVIGRLGDVPVCFALVRIVLDEAELMLLAVSPDHQRLGFGQLILQHVLELLQSDNCARCFLEVRDGNPAKHLYDRIGFVQYSRRQNYYRGKDGEVFDAISYSINLI